MSPVHFLCLMHPGAAAAAATAVVISMWVLEEWREQDTAKPTPKQQQSREGDHGTNSTAQGSPPPVQTWEADRSSSHLQDERPHPRPSSSTQQHPAATAMARQQPTELPTASVIHQPPPADYGTRIPILAPFTAVAVAPPRHFTAAQLQLRHTSHPPLLLQPLASDLSLRPQPGQPIPHPSTFLGGSSSSSSSAARRLPFKLLAAAAAVLLGAAAFPSAVNNYSFEQQQQQQPGRLPAEQQPGPLSAAAADPPAHSSSSSSAPGALRGRQFDRWMRQQLPTVLQQKQEELQRLQSMQVALRDMQVSSRNSSSSSSGGVQQGAGRVVAAVFGALGGCLGEEVESLQIQVAALAGAAAAGPP